MSALSLAVPLLAQVAGAQSSATTDEDNDVLDRNRPVLSQECVLAMAGLEEAHLANIDAMIAKQKTFMQTRVDSLKAAAQIADDTARMEALEAAHEDRKPGDEQEAPEEVQTAMEAVKTACGDVRMFHKGPGGPHRGFMMGGMMGGKMGMMKIDLSEKLGMTDEELKAELDSGKTIEEIAKEKGVELPARPEGGRGFGFFHKEFGAAESAPTQQ